MIDRQVKFLGWLIAFMIVSNSTILLPFSWGIGYYAVLLCALIFVVSKPGIKINLYMACLYAAAMLSITLNDVPSFFKPWPRFGTFLLLTLIVAPSLMGKVAAKFKVHLFSSIVLLLNGVMIISIVMLFLGMGRNYLAGWFHGAMTHSMLMGPVAAIVSLFGLYQLQYRFRKKWVRYAYMCSIASSFLCLLQTGSRSALIGAVLSILSFMYFRYAAHIGRVVRNYCILGLLLIAAFPMWSPYADKIIEKNQGNTAALDTSSRSEHWEQRFAEWESSPIYGIGFSSVDAQSEVSTYDRSTGGVETGNSWLSVLSMTGLLGGTCVFVIFFVAIVRGWKVLRFSSPVGAFLLSILVFFIFHMMAEGYIFAGGNFLNTQLWLLLGTIYSISQYPQYVELLERKLQLGQ